MKPGLLIISHGSRDESWVTLVEEAIAKVQWPQGVAVASSYLECVPERDIQYGIDILEAQGVDHIGVIPLFVSAGSTHADEIAYALGAKPAPLCETDMEPFRVRARVYYGRPLDGGDVVLSEEQAQSCHDWDQEEQLDLLLHMIEARLRSLGVRPNVDAVLLVAHGSRYEPFASRWHSSLRRLERLLVLRGQCVGASHALLCCEDIAGAVQRLRNVLDVSADGIQWSGRAEQLTVPLDVYGGMDTLDGTGGQSFGEQTVKRHVAVVPVFLSRGYFTSHAIPQRLGDLPVQYDGEALLPHPALSEWLQQEAVRLLTMMSDCGLQ